MDARYIQIGIRFPQDVKEWLEAEAKKNRSSQNSEVVRAVRRAMDGSAGAERTEETAASQALRSR